MPHQAKEIHYTAQTGRLRAAVLGANDGIISIASLVVGIAASGAPKESVLLAGVAGVVAGATSMAAGEYVSVQSQADIERADLIKEQRELSTEPQQELEELTGVYVARGLDQALARQVAQALTARDALAAHARDELGITDALRARPLQAAVASGLSFVAGAAVPLIAILIVPTHALAEILTGISILTLATLGAVAAHAGGAPVARGASRVAFWGAIAMGLTAVIGRLFGTGV